MRGTFDCPLRVGQRVRHTDYQGKRITGVVHGLSVEHERGLMVDCVLDQPIILPATDQFEETKLHRQYAPAHEFAAFDERDELVAELTKELAHATRFFDQLTPSDAERMRKVLEKAGGAV